MNHTMLRITVAACLLLLAACGDKHEPVKPTVVVQLIHVINCTLGR